MKTEIMQSSSPQIVASLDSLITHILLNLPIRSLIRFKSVSHHWNSLISDPHFCFLRNPNPNPAVGFFTTHLNRSYEYVPLSGDAKSTYPPFPNKLFNDNPHETIAVQQSCNGLLLCCMFSSREYVDIFYVCNPTTNRFSTLPKPDEGYCGSLEKSLAFDPAKSPYYKVVCAYLSGVDIGIYGSRDYKYQFKIYSSETRVWAECGKPVVSKGKFGNGVYWNGAIHWIADPRSGEFSYLNLDDHVLRVMSMPSLADGVDFRRDFCFRESCDHLHYIVENTRPVRLLIVYEMMRDYSEWFVNYQVDLTPLAIACSGMTRSNPVFNFEMCYPVRGETDRDSFLVLQILGKVIRYNIVCQSFETIYEFASAEVEGCMSYQASGFQYIKSLCCVYFFSFSSYLVFGGIIIYLWGYVSD